MTEEATRPDTDALAKTVDAIVLVRADDPEAKPQLYACPKCGGVHSPRIYLASEGEAHKAARAAAENCYDCRTHGTCDTCGDETSKGWTRCINCRELAKLEKAIEIEDDGGPYCRFGGDTYYFDIDEARDDGCEWVSPCTVHYPRIDIDDIFENLTSEMFEDASVDDLDGVDALCAAVKVFNESQRTPTFFGDDSRKIRVAESIEIQEALGEA